MSTIEPVFKITRIATKISSISVEMPIQTERSFDGYLKVHMPLLDIMIWAKDQEYVEEAVKAALIGLCLAAEQFGKGMEKELESMGWILTGKEADSSIFTYDSVNRKTILERIMRTSDNYINKQLQIA
jgi:hypothetical protein